MKKEEVFAKLVFGDVEAIEINGVTISSEVIIDTFKNKAWKSALVIKNRREAETGGLKSIVGRALTLKIIDANEGLAIILSNDKARAKTISEQFPETEKSDEPIESDVEQAIALVLSGGGQNVSI